MSEELKRRLISLMAETRLGVNLNMLSDTYWDEVFDCLADNLIANGVTIQEKNSFDSQHGDEGGWLLERRNIKFETGDNAKIVGNVTEHRFEIGTIVRLEKYDTDYKAFAGDDFWWVSDDDLEPIEDVDTRGVKDDE